MTTNPPSEKPREDRPSGETHACYNCFADFIWAPTIHDGEEFCCSGCVEGGPCICTYDGPPKSVEYGISPTAVVSDGELELEADIKIDPRRKILLEAIEELPAQLRKIARLRVVSEAPIGEIARDSGMTLEETENTLKNSQAIIWRMLGEGFSIEHIPDHTLPERAVISKSASPRQPEPLSESVAEDANTFDLSAAIRAPLEALTAPLLGIRSGAAETAIAQNTIREALRDASAIFRLASERLGEDPNEHPLHRLLADESADEIRIIADGLTEPAMYLVALDGLSSVRWARVESKEEHRTIFAVEAASSGALVRDVMGLASPFRPIRLVVRDTEIEITLPAEASNGVPVAAVSPQFRTQPVFELGADAFFGARHFVTMGGIQGPPHHHSFRVEALMETSAQDSDGVVLGFGDAKKLIESIVLDYNESLLNTVEPFTRIQPTSENIAKVIFDRLKVQLTTNDIRLKQVRVWESPTNSASYSDAVLAI
ncbi:MAG: 6-carboxytetrahydropterin synthase [Chloroflexi bacterium]|jgi:6-pyruvoyltetrahydropterin/6-carboxytetrahydropterin synthase|nr:6-carboxytetrahydropterin synthase [Chloroflexota bacterium]